MRYRSLVLKFLSAFIVFGAWEIAGRVPVSFAFPTFIESMVAFWVLLVEGTMFVAYAETLKPLVVGVLISAFLGIGMVKGKMLNVSVMKSGFETLIVGGAAASISYLVGYFLHGLQDIL